MDLHDIGASDLDRPAARRCPAGAGGASPYQVYVYAGHPPKHADSGPHVSLPLWLGEAG